MSGPFSPGELTASQAAKLNDLWDARSRSQLAHSSGSTVVKTLAGVPVFGTDPPRVLLCEVTVVSAATPPVHTVKRLTRDTDNTITDYGPSAVTFENVLDPNEEGFEVGDMVAVTQFPDQDGYRWAWPLTVGGGDTWFWAEITGGTDAGGYSWKRKYLSAAATWSDASSPAPLTGSANAYRAPSIVTSPPAIPSGQVVLIRPSPTLAGKYEVGPWGGRQTISHVLVTDVSATCSAGTIVLTKTTQTLTITGRDLTSSLS